MSHRTGLPSNALAPVGSEHIAKAYPQYFPYKGENITTYGRKRDIFFYSNISKQSGDIVILPDLAKNELGTDVSVVENHYLHNFQPYQIYQAKPYEKKQNINLPFIPMPWIGGVQNNGKPLGLAADIDYDLIDKILSETSQPKPQSGLYGYTNPLTGSNHIYTREEVNSMSPEEFVKREKEIMSQTKAFNGTMPTMREPAASIIWAT